MVYSDNVKELLESNNVKVSDNIELILKDGRTFNGILMPRGDTNPNVLVIKLSNGYNVGFDFLKVKALKTLGHVKKVKPILKQEKGKGPYIHVIGAGGTIASRVEYKTGAVYPLTSEKELLNAFPEIAKIAQIKSSQPFSLFSEDMAPEIWVDLAKEINSVLKNKPKGIVIPHGTDTMHYTSAALSFFFPGLPCPLILTGAQRSSDRGSSDAKINMFSSIIAAKHDFADVGVCMHKSMNDDNCYVHKGVRVRKMHSSMRSAFKSINVKPLMEIDWKNQKVIELDNLRKPSKLEMDTKMNTNVAMQYIYPGITGKQISSLSDYDGVVLMGTGLGHVSTNPFNSDKVMPIIKEIDDLTSSGVAVVMSTQTIFGRVNMNVYTSGRLLQKAGVIGNLCDWTPETAYVKLMWVLGHYKKWDKVKEVMETNIAGEISQCSIIEDMPEENSDVV